VADAVAAATAASWPRLGSADAARLGAIARLYFDIDDTLT
jgi:hypothetical protein